MLEGLFELVNIYQVYDLDEVPLSSDAHEIHGQGGLRVCSATSDLCIYVESFTCSSKLESFTIILGNHSSM